MRGLVLAAVLAACSSEGVYLEVRVPAGMPVNQVDLYLAAETCDPQRDDLDCDAIVPPRFDANDRSKVIGNVFFVDDSLPFVSTPDADGSAWFYLDPSSSAIVLPAAIAVGHDPAAGETGVALFGAIDLGVTQHLRIDLAPVGSTHVVDQTRTEVEVWRAANDDYRCVAAHVDRNVVYIVPRGDPDCDELAPAGSECEPGIHLATGQAVPDLLEKLTCPVQRVNAACVLGGEVCDETAPVAQRDTCKRSETTYCVPDATCLCETLDDACFASLFVPPNQGGSKIACTIEGTNEGGNFHTCENRQLVPTRIVANKPCSTPELSPLEDRLTKFGAPIDLNLANGDKVTLEPIVVPPCEISVNPPNASLNEALPPGEPLQMFLKIDTEPMTPGKTFVIMPFEVKFELVADCATATNTRCDFLDAPGDLVRTCFP